MGEDIKNVGIEDLRSYLQKTLKVYGLVEENSEIVADIILRATYRGSMHHDIHMFADRLESLISEKIKANPEYMKLHEFGAMEAWDADNGLGELVCDFGMNRAMDLAEQYGVGICAMRNTNHFMAAGPYVEKAAERGYIGLILCKGTICMGAPGASENCISQLPFGFAYPTNYEYPVMLDSCMAYASIGQLQWKEKNKEEIPTHWGVNKEGKATSDPRELLQGIRYPIGEHKGLGLAMLGEALTGVFSDGCIMDEKITPDGINNMSSHTFIAIKMDAFISLEEAKSRSTLIQDRMKALSPKVHIPGEGNHTMKEKIRKRGYIEIHDEAFEELLQYGDRFGISLKEWSMS